MKTKRCLCFLGGRGCPEKVLASGGLARSSSTGFRSHPVCPTTAPEDPDDPADPKRSLLKGMPQAYKEVISNRREKLEDLFAA